MPSDPTVRLSKDVHSELKKVAHKKGLSMQKFIEHLLNEIDIAGKEEVVIMKIPKKLTRNNRDGLNSWLKSHMNAVFDSYYPER